MHQSRDGRMIGHDKSREKISIRLVSLPLVVSKNQHLSPAGTDVFLILQKFYYNRCFYCLCQFRQDLSVNRKSGIIQYYRFSLPGWDRRKLFLKGMKKRKIRCDTQDQSFSRHTCIVNYLNSANRGNSILMK